MASLWIPGLAMALPLQKALLLAFLHRWYGQSFGAGELALALLPEAAIAAALLLLARLPLRRPGRAALATAALLLAIATWSAVAPWAFTGTVVPWALALRLIESPEAVVTALRSEDLVGPLAVAVGALGASVIAGAVLASGLSRLWPESSRGTRSAAWLVLPALALAVSTTRAAAPLDRLAVLTAFDPASETDSVRDATSGLDTEVLSALGPRPAPPRAALPGVENVLVLVLESVRVEPGSMFMTGFPEALHFDRVYAHHPRSVKTLEALVFGIYPSPGRATAAWDIGRYDVEAMQPLPKVLARRGFESSYLGSMNLSFDGYGRALELAGFDHVERTEGKQKLTWGVAADRLFGRVEETLLEGRRRGAPQFVVAWTTECHRPYDTEPGAPLSGTPLDRYRSCLDALAGSVQGLLDRLQADGILARTLVLLFGDHGQTFEEERPDDLAYGQQVYEEGLRVPLLVVAPPEAGLGTGSRDGRLFQIVDVPRTIVGALGLPAPDGWVGRDLLDPGEAGRERAFVASVLDSRIVGSVDRTRRKEVRRRDGEIVAYDLASDPAEARPRALAGEERDAVERRLDTYLTVARDGWATRLRAGDPRGETYEGPALQGFGRMGACLAARPAPEGAGLAVKPSDRPECSGSHNLRRWRVVRRLGPGGDEGTHGLDLTIRLRLDAEPASANPLHARARIGKAAPWIATRIAPDVGRWQSLTLRLPSRRRASGGDRSTRETTLQLVPLDAPLPYTIASIHLAPGTAPASTGATPKATP